MSSCPYEILGVPREAETSQIKKAYRKLARTCHPDVAPGQRDRFEAITNAYKVLSNDLYRRFYDQFRKDPLELGLDDKTIRRALFETRKRVSKEKVARSGCEDCDGTGIRLSGRLCTSCDPALDKKPEPEAPPDPRAEGERYRMRRPNPQRVERDAPVGLDDLMGTATVEADAGAHKRMRLRRPKK